MKDLNKNRIIAISGLRDEIDKVNSGYVKSVTKFKKGDLVEYIEKGDHYNFEDDDYVKGKICGFDISSDGSVNVQISGMHSKPSIEDIKLFDPSDYAFRDRVTPIPELNIGDEFYIVIEKPRTTVGKPYTVDKKVETSDSIEYYFYNDRDQQATISAGDYRIAL